MDITLQMEKQYQLNVKKLQEVLLKTLQEPEEITSETTNYDYLEMFIAAKKIEGCSERTVSYYKSTVEHLLKNIETPIRKITTDEIRNYLAKYQENGGCSKTTVDNIRRNISSFFSWLEEEDYILKSPMKRIHKIKTLQPVKEIISDELIERLLEVEDEVTDQDEEKEVEETDESDNEECPPMLTPAEPEE